MSLVGEMAKKKREECQIVMLANIEHGLSSETCEVAAGRLGTVPGLRSIYWNLLTTFELQRSSSH